MVAWTVPNQSVSLTRVTDYRIMDYSALDYGITDYSRRRENLEVPRLLHSRRVPVQATASDEACSAAPPADDRPPCAGIGDENCHVWTCWECLRDIVAKNQTCL